MRFWLVLPNPVIRTECEMGKIEDVVRSEIVRLAQKEDRAACGPLAKQVRELKRTVSVLKRSVAAMQKTVAGLRGKAAAEKATLQAPAEEVKVARISPGLIKKLRTRLGLTQGKLAALCGVSLPAVTFWENGRSRPQGKNREAIVALRKLGKREVRKLLAEKAAAKAQEAPKPKARAKTKRKAKTRAK